jgi:hypothetical protein
MNKLRIVSVANVKNLSSNYFLPSMTPLKTAILDELTKSDVVCYRMNNKKVRCNKCGQWKENKTAWCPNYRSHNSAFRFKQKRFVHAPKSA